MSTESKKVMWHLFRQLRERVPEFYSTAPVLAEDNKVKYLLPDPVYLGVEFEWEQTGSPWTQAHHNFPKLENYWMVVQDGSLRGEDAFELKTTGGLPPHYVETALDHMWSYSRKWSASRRTGIHVHLNVCDLTWRQFSNLVSLYALLEPAIYTAAGDERSANPFSVPLYKDSFVSGRIALALMNQNETVPYLQQINKYGGLNLACVMKYGTVEFRHLRTTHDQTKILNWIKMIQVLRRYAMLPSFEKEFSRHLERRTYRALLEDVYQGKPWDALIYPELTEELNWLGSDTAHEFFYVREARKAATKQQKPKERNITVNDVDNAWEIHQATLAGQDLQLRITPR